MVSLNAGNKRNYDGFNPYVFLELGDKLLGIRVPKRACGSTRVNVL